MSIIVETKYGKVAGVQRDGLVSFFGIPYAKPPVGELRFRKTQKADKWDDVLPCDHFGPRCPQPTTFFTDKKISNSEADCLTLNIWTPACDVKKRPVLFWVHGGAFITGDAAQGHRDGSSLVIDGNIVVVSIQYRLGAFGFYDFSELSGARGRFDCNCGMYDQVTALEWVYDNIATFGGDPEQIVVMGESAGASSVETLITIPRIKGKIKRAVMESPIADGVLTKKAAKYNALLLLKELGIPEVEAYRVADLPTDVLVEAVNKVDANMVNCHPISWSAGPVMDGELIPHFPLDAIEDGYLGDMPILLGSSKDEASMFVNPKGKSNLPYSTESVDNFFRLNPHLDKEKILKLYPGYPSLDAIKEFGKDFVFHIGTIFIAEAQRKNTVYMFRYDYVSPLMKLLNLGAMHTGEAMFVCGIIEKSPFVAFDKKNARMLGSFIHTAWLNFVKYGNPNGTGETIWPEYGEDRNTLILDRTLSVEKDPSLKVRKALHGLRVYRD